MNYLQKKGCAMGTKCAPSYANIFIGWFEEKLIFPFLTNLRDFYRRFIDDIFPIWKGTKTEFDDFLKKSMTAILASNLNIKCLKRNPIFLTPQCLKWIRNYKLKCVSNKPKDEVIYTANQNILTPIKKSITYSHALRFNKICYNRSDLHNNCKRLLN